jgi:hypothetical protein
MKCVGGAHVIAVATLDQAREHLTTSPFNIALLDHNLAPGQVGTTLAIERREQVRWTQCQAQSLDQFSVWVPPITLSKCLTLGLRARAGRSGAGRRRCALPARKIRLAPPALPTIQLDWTAVVERLMRTLGVVELEILANPQSGLACVVVVGQIHLLDSPHEMRNEFW